MVPLPAAKGEKEYRIRLKESDRKFLVRIIAEWIRYRLHEIESKYGRELEELGRLDEERERLWEERRYRESVDLEREIRKKWEEIRPELREDEIEWGLALLERIRAPLRGRPSKPWLWGFYKKETRNRVLNEVEETVRMEEEG